MTSTNRTALSLLHQEREGEIGGRLAEFSAVPEAEYFYELVYCLLTPQSSARNADAVVHDLKARDFEHQPIDPEPILRSREHYIRFHRTKSGHLLRLKQEYAEVLDKIAGEKSAQNLRDWLAENVKGLGLKEATHFLRNIGRNGDLAILDRHILRNLVRHGVIRGIPKTLTKKHYLRIEKRFQLFASELKIPINELDLLFWSMETGEIRK